MHVFASVRPYGTTTGFSGIMFEPERWAAILAPESSGVLSGGIYAGQTTIFMATGRI